jgi:hypothetical protein
MLDFSTLDQTRGS